MNEQHGVHKTWQDEIKEFDEYTGILSQIENEYCVFDPPPINPYEHLLKRDEEEQRKGKADQGQKRGRNQWKYEDSGFTRYIDKCMGVNSNWREEDHGSDGEWTAEFGEDYGDYITEMELWSQLELFDKEEMQMDIDMEMEYVRCRSESRRPISKFRVLTNEAFIRFLDEYTTDWRCYADDFEMVHLWYDDYKKTQLYLEIKQRDYESVLRQIEQEEEINFLRKNMCPSCKASLCDIRKWL